MGSSPVEVPNFFFSGYKFAIAWIAMTNATIISLFKCAFPQFTSFSLNENTVWDGSWDRLWISNASSLTRLFQNKVVLLLKIMLIHDKPLLSDQPPWSGNLLVHPEVSRLMEVELYFMAITKMWRHKQKPRGKNKYLIAKKKAHDGNKN